MKVIKGEGNYGGSVPLRVVLLERVDIRVSEGGVRPLSRAPVRGQK